jgi:hypothetical protein
MQTHGHAATQLLQDLLTVRDKLDKGWLKGGFQAGQSVCIVAAVNQTAGLANVAHYTRVSVDHTENEARVGRMILSIFEAIYGPEAVTDDLTVSRAAQQVAAFNDCQQDGRYVDKATVLLAIDKAIEAVLAPPVVTEPASKVPAPVTAEDLDGGTEVVAPELVTA